MIRHKVGDIGTVVEVETNGCVVTVKGITSTSGYSPSVFYAHESLIPVKDDPTDQLNEAVDWVVQHLTGGETC